VVFFFAEGELGVMDILSIRNRITTDPSYSPKLALLVDGRLAKITFSGPEAVALGDWYKVNRPFSRAALVVGPKTRRIIRKARAWSDDDDNIGFFEDMESAREWLGLSPNDA